MKPIRPVRKHVRRRHRRSGFSAKEVVLSTAVVLSFTMGMYFLAELCFSRVYHFVSTMVGSPYL